MVEAETIKNRIERQYEGKCILSKLTTNKTDFL